MSVGFDWNKINGYVYVDKGEGQSFIYSITDSDFRFGVLESKLDWRLTGPLDKGDKFPKDVEQVPLLVIKPEFIPTRKTVERSVASCALMATDEYLQHFLGRKLDTNDRSWYNRNSLCNNNGLPQPVTFTVLQMLVEPYNCGISRIVIPRNGRLFEEYKVFMKSLGCNPFFLTDGITTNEEALAILFPDEIERAKHKSKMLNEWRFECRDEPMASCVLMRQFSDGPGHNGGSSYRGPRDNTKIDNWIMSIQFDDLRNINYHRPVESPEYKNYEGHIEFDFMSIVCPETKKTIRALSSSRWNKHQSSVRQPWPWEKTDQERGISPKDEGTSKNNTGVLEISDKSKGEIALIQETPKGENKDNYPKECDVCSYDAGNFWQGSTKCCIECGAVQNKIATLKNDMPGDDATDDEWLAWWHNDCATLGQ